MILKSPKTFKIIMRKKNSLEPQEEILFYFIFFNIFGCYSYIKGVSVELTLLIELLKFSVGGGKLPV